MKKLISALLSVCIIMAVLCVAATAESTANNTYSFETEEGSCTVIFLDNNLTEEQQIAVAEKLVFGEDDSAQTYNWLCTASGHNYKNSTTKVIWHKDRTYAPRCEEITYQIRSCQRCDFSETIGSTSRYIYCCPED